MIPQALATIGKVPLPSFNHTRLLDHSWPRTRPGRRRRPHRQGSRHALVIPRLWPLSVKLPLPSLSHTRLPDRLLVTKASRSPSPSTSPRSRPSCVIPQALAAVGKRAAAVVEPHAVALITVGHEGVQVAVTIHIAKAHTTSSVIPKSSGHCRSKTPTAAVAANTTMSLSCAVLLARFVSGVSTGAVTVAVLVTIASTDYGRLPDSITVPVIVYVMKLPLVRSIDSFRSPLPASVAAPLPVIFAVQATSVSVSGNMSVTVAPVTSTWSVVGHHDRVRHLTTLHHRHLVRRLGNRYDLLVGH